MIFRDVIGTYARYLLDGNLLEGRQIQKYFEKKIMNKNDITILSFRRTYLSYKFFLNRIILLFLAAK